LPFWKLNVQQSNANLRLRYPRSLKGPNVEHGDLVLQTPQPASLSLVYLDKIAVAEFLMFPALRSALAEAIRQGGVVPERAVHKIPPDRGLGLMPAWRPGSDIGVKVVIVVPGNVVRNLSTIQGLVLLFDYETGQPRAALDGAEVTVRRTAAASSLAASLLARKDASRYALLGCGALALPMIEAMSTVRPIREIRVWGRSFDKAKVVAAKARARFPQLMIHPVATAADAVSRADIVSTLTSSPEPILQGAWIESGAHLDLVGSHSPDTRELDDDGVSRARVFVDFRSSVMLEAGDILIPLRSGAISQDHILGDLSDLLTGSIDGRTTDSDITVFKSVGNGLEDLVAAQTALSQFQATQPSSRSTP
jgi:ornithine cyclodeaminase/alanine dehydrogenase-like protein (mu-crystallin family)